MTLGMNGRIMGVVGAAVVNLIVEIETQRFEDVVL